MRKHRVSVRDAVERTNLVSRPWSIDREIEDPRDDPFYGRLEDIGSDEEIARFPFYWWDWPDDELSTGCGSESEESCSTMDSECEIEADWWKRYANCRREGDCCLVCDM
jgi:hypothetical protein